jgi:hypothetical protein
VQEPSRSLPDIDAWLAAELSAELLAAKPFAHLPVLGVPGWWAENDDSAFYADSSVFREPRSGNHLASATPLRSPSESP